MNPRIICILVGLFGAFLLAQSVGVQVIVASSLDDIGKEGFNRDDYIILRTTYPSTQSVYCDICGKQVIDGSYTTLKSGHQVCSECIKLPQCAICGLPASTHKRHIVHGKLVCDDCFHTADRCVYCDQPVVGKTYGFPGGKKADKWCVQDSTIDHCYLCGVPLKPEDVAHEDKYNPREGTKKLCAVCFKDRPKCSSCGKPILGLVYTFESSDGKYCFDCKTRGPFCEVCEVPTIDRRDEIWMCKRCQQNTMSQSQVDSLFQLIVVTLEDSLRFLVWSEIQVQSATRANMSAIRNGSDLGFVKTEETISAGFFCYDGDALTIYLRKGLSSSEAMHSLAHEYGHAWQLENALSVQSRELSEGLAEWVAYKLLGCLGKKAEVEKMRRRTEVDSNRDIYAKGLHLMLDIEANEGVKGVIEYAKPDTGFEGRVVPVLGDGG